MTARPRGHRAPTAAEAARALCAALDEPEVRLRPVAEGGEHATWWAGTRHVARFALDEAGSARQRREIVLRDLVRPYVGVPLPASVATGEWARGRTFTVDTRLPGTSAEERRVGAVGEADLARLLAGLRSVPVRAATDLGTPVEPPVPGTPAVLLHNDLKGEHLKVTGDGGVCGVLDWTDAAVGDPAADIAGLAIAVGAAAAVRVARAAGYDDAVCLRGVLRARHDTVLLLAGRLTGRDDSPLPLLRAQRARAWEPTPLDGGGRLPRGAGGG